MTSTTGWTATSGNEQPALDERYKTDQNLIEGCQSRVWLQADEEDGKVIFQAESDALIVKGIIALLIKVLSGHTPDEILAADLYFIPRIGLQEHLSPTRSNGLLAMVKHRCACTHSPSRQRKANLTLAHTAQTCIPTPLECTFLFPSETRQGLRHFVYALVIKQTDQNQNIRAAETKPVLLTDMQKIRHWTAAELFRLQQDRYTGQRAILKPRLPRRQASPRALPPYLHGRPRAKRRNGV